MVRSVFGRMDLQLGSWRLGRWLGNLLLGRPLCCKHCLSGGELWVWDRRVVWQGIGTGQVSARFHHMLPTRTRRRNSRWGRLHTRRRRPCRRRRRRCRCQRLIGFNLSVSCAVRPGWAQPGHNIPPPSLPLEMETIPHHAWLVGMCCGMHQSVRY